MIRAPNRNPTLLNQLRANLARSTHYMATATTHMRHCYYCAAPAQAAFYLQDQKAWACVPCYIQTYVPTPVPSKEPALAAAS